MSNQPKLTALLHELQHARSPIAQARVLARSWRTLRELSPTDRRLLARHAGFDGAEEILEGLSHKGGLAPAMLLRVLANARATDNSTVSELLAAFRDPDRRGDAISKGAELASDLLAEPEFDKEREEVGEALEELKAAEATIVDETEEALAALEAVGSDDANRSEDAASEALFEEEPGPRGVTEDEAEFQPEADSGTGTQSEPEPGPENEPGPETGPETGPEPEPPPPPPPPPEPVVDWSRWHSAREGSRPAPQPRLEGPTSLQDAGPRRLVAGPIIEAIRGQQSVFSQLRMLRCELSRFDGSSAATLSELIEAFPDGWARRRALCALLEVGMVPGDDDAMDLVLKLGRESDRRWCLGFLARRGGLSGSNLERAIDLLSSPWSQRRLRMAAQR